MNKPYMIADKDGRFFRGWTDSIPLIVNAFADALDSAARFESLAEAEEARTALMERLYELDGNTRVAADYLRIVRIELKVIS